METTDSTPIADPTPEPYLSVDESERYAQFYKMSHDSVQEVLCPNDGRIALLTKAADGGPNEPGRTYHPENRYITAVGTCLLATRVRLDGMIGFECSCGLDSRWSTVEKEIVSREHIMTSLTRQDMINVKNRIDVSGYEPNLTVTDTGYIIDEFEIRNI